MYDWVMAVGAAFLLVAALGAFVVLLFLYPVVVASILAVVILSGIVAMLAGFFHDGLQEHKQARGVRK